MARALPQAALTKQILWPVPVGTRWNLGQLSKPWKALIDFRRGGLAKVFSSPPGQGNVELLAAAMNLQNASTPIVRPLWRTIFPGKVWREEILTRPLERAL